MEKRRGFAAVNDTHLYYEIAGSGAPLVLIHGSPNNTQIWDLQFEILAHQYQVIRYDARGYGSSALPATGGEYSHSHDLKALLDQLEMAPSHVLGHSMGGGVALDLAISCPGAVSSLILADSTLNGFSWSREWQEMNLALRRELAPLYAERRPSDAVQRMLEAPILRSIQANPDATFLLSRSLAADSGWHWTNEDPVRSLDSPAAARLKEIQAPTLVMVGEFDMPDFHVIADILESGIVKARKVVLEGVGHYAHLESPEMFNETILSFLSSV